MNPFLVVHAGALILRGEVTAGEWHVMRRMEFRGERPAPEPMVVEEQTGL